ncbi:MAG: yidC [Actinomycetia bacterium]|jgi:YidC/Oxa1 family membrane protein insertase|nr:yidC [Actinomycetes bacterium]
MFGFLGVPVDAAYHLVFALTHLLTPASGGLAAAAAIVLFTAVVRLLISPLSFRALRGQAAMARLAPQVQSLRTRYGRQPERFNREVTALYKREGTSPLSGILPLLAQWPFLSVTYLLFRSATVGGAQNQLLSDGLFGVPLGAHWLPAAGLLSVHDALFLAVFAVLAALCWLSARLAKRAATPAVAPAAGSKTAGLVTLVLPYLTVVIAAFAPLAAAIYLLTTVAWTFAERSIFLRRTARAASAPPARTPVTLVRPARSGTRSHRRGPVR